jgi:hypothetical protein
LAATAAIAYLTTFGAGLSGPRADQNQQALIEWLQRNQMTRGYGDYWAAGILTAESRGSLKIRQVMATNTGYHPLQWMMNQNWYSTSKSDDSFNFLVLDNSNIDNVNEESARKFFGNPKDEYQVAGYKVLVWDKSLPVRE